MISNLKTLPEIPPDKRKKSLTQIEKITAFHSCSKSSVLLPTEGGSVGINLSHTV